MQELDSVIDRIREQEEERMQEAERIRREAGSTMFGNGPTVEDELLQEVSPDPLEDVSVSGVDGGFAKKAFHGVDIVMVRAVATRFRYQEGRLVGTEYVPEKRPTPRIEHVSENLPRNSVDRLTSLIRLQEEVGQALQVVDGSDAVLLDGSLVPQYPDKPSGGVLGPRYRELIASYKSLYDAANDGDVLLAGVVEDTRDTAVCNVLQENGFASDVVASCRDSHLLHYLMEKGERTLLLRYSENENHPILKDLPEYRRQLYSFYLKAAGNDRPIRVDILAPGNPTETVDRIAPLIYTLAGVNNSYGIPAPLIEADQRAKLDGHEVDLVTRRIQTKLGHLSGMQGLRRDRRPF